MILRLAVALGALVAATVISFGQAYAQAAPGQVARSPDGKVVLKLSDAKCELDLSRVPAEYHKDFKGGTSTWDGKPHKLCWAIEMPGLVFMLFDDAEYMRLSEEEFKSPGAANAPRFDHGGPHWQHVNPRQLIEI